MKIPFTPPDANKIIHMLMQDNNAEFLKLLTDIGPVDSKGRYLHWDKLRHLSPPGGFTTEQWWSGVKLARRAIYKTTNFSDKDSNPFVFATPDCVWRDLHWLDQNTAGNVSANKQITNPQTKDTYLVRSLINEAISSSQLEGATTTREIAKNMLRRGRKPQDKSEQMIYNNYRAMEFIRDHSGDPLTENMVLSLRRILTEDALDDPKSAGRYRSAKDNIHVFDERDGTTVHTPPDAKELPDRMKRLCKFANDDNSKDFVHPIIRAIILHFMLAYDHPFKDGNGRTARALFYWSVAKSGYWIMEFISISEIIKKAPAEYSRAFLYTETDDNDLTYFIVHQLKVIKKGIDLLLDYLDKKEEEIESAIKQLEETNYLRGRLNFRQISLLKHALKNPRSIYRIREHQTTHGLSYETARSDLMKMSDKLGLLDREKLGKTSIFISPTDLKKRIKVQTK